MPAETQLYYICIPDRAREVSPRVEILPVQDFLANEAACSAMWEMITDTFRTRGKFLAIWPSVRFVAVHRDPDSRVTGLLTISAPINWQIDYVVVRPECRGQGIAAALLDTALNAAHETSVPYVMLTSKESLRPLYEASGFHVVGSSTEQHPDARSVKVAVMA